MTQDEIIEMAKQTQMPFYWRTGEITYLDKLEAFAKLVAQHEREACAKIGDDHPSWSSRMYSATIRARDKQDGECKHCTVGCPACDARKLPEQDWIERERAVGYREGHRAALAQCTWVGLTDKEIEEIWKIAMFTDYGIGAELSNQPFVHYARAIEAKLKERTHEQVKVE